mmetsp:Transcript_28245/g.86561  ORF Transcript_28245/g.86561 Transcript_28245/m.86561 type:complete len:258 (-) Transcript_28245:271-1044(-)
MLPSCESSPGAHQNRVLRRDLGDGDSFSVVSRRRRSRRGVVEVAGDEGAEVEGGAGPGGGEGEGVEDVDFVLEDGEVDGGAGGFRFGGPLDDGVAEDFLAADVDAERGLGDLGELAPAGGRGRQERGVAVGWVAQPEVVEEEEAAGALAAAVVVLGGVVEVTDGLVRDTVGLEGGEDVVVGAATSGGVEVYERREQKGAGGFDADAAQGQQGREGQRAAGAVAAQHELVSSVAVVFFEDVADGAQRVDERRRKLRLR